MLEQDFNNEGYLEETEVFQINTQHCFFNEEEQTKLAAEIKIRDVMWDPRLKDHSNSVIVGKLWDEVAAAMGKPVEECKAVWVAMLEEKRHRMESPEDEPIPLGFREEDRDFAANMITSRTSGSSKSSSPTSSSPGAAPEENNSSRRSQSRSRSSTPPQELSAAERFAASLSKLVDQDDKQQLKYKQSWPHFDRMISRLEDPDVVEEVFNDIQNVIFKALQEQRNRKRGLDRMEAFD